MPEIQGVVTDLDNTFLYADSHDRDVIPDSHVEALQITESFGVPVLPVTGRSLSLMNSVQATADFRHSAVLDGGASVYDFRTGTYISKRWLSEQQVRELAGAIKPHATLLSCEVEYNPTPADELDIEELQGESPSVFAEYEIDKEETLLRALGRVANINTIGPMHTSKPGIRCVQVTQPGVDKLSGIQIMLEHEGLQDARLLGIEDNTNGIPLFQAVGDQGIKVPMGDAPEELKALANRPPVGTAEQEGWAYAIRRYVIEPRRYGIDDQVLRPTMDAEVRDSILMRLDNGEPLADRTFINEMITDFRSPDSVDPWLAVAMLVRALGEADQLLTCDLDVLRPLRGDEHAGTVLSGMEDDYIQSFRDAPPEVRVVLRLGAEFGDIGKVLAVADTGQNFAQAGYNRRSAVGILQSADLPDYGKRAVELLNSQDIIGGLLQRRDGAEEALRDLRRQWPPELAEYFDDILLAVYLSDASAHSSHRKTLYARSGQLEPAVRPDDAKLDFLFARHPSGALTLTPDRAELIARHLPGLHRLRHLVTPAN